MTRLELERELTKAQKHLSIAESKGAEKDVVNTFRDRVAYYQNAISIKTRNNNSASDFMVEFKVPYKKISIGSSKEIYIEAIREFGIDNIKSNVKDFFCDQPMKGKESQYERLEPNVYLYVQINNANKIKQLLKIGSQTGREIMVTPI